MLDLKINVSNRQSWASLHLEVYAIRIWDSCNFKINCNILEGEALEGEFLPWEACDVSIDCSIEIEAREGELDCVNVRTIFPCEGMGEVARYCRVYLIQIDSHVGD